MSGHSKWATIHRQKEAKDSKRGAVFTKLANMITIAVKEGGGIGDADKNFKLRLVLDKARAANMPKDNISRAIDRATGAGGSEFTEAVFEGFLPGGVGVLVQTLSDNKLRSGQFVREILDKNGGVVANSGSVSHGFVQMGELQVESELDPEECELALMDIEGVEDLEKIEDKTWQVWCNKAELFNLKTKLDAKGFSVKSAELAMKPVAEVEVSDNETKEKIEAILTKLEDVDDVARVWTNYQPV